MSTDTSTTAATTAEGSAAPRPSTPTTSKRSIPVFVPDGYVVRKQRPGEDADEVEEPAAAQPPRRSTTGLVLVLALGLVLGYATGFAVARHAEPALVTVTVAGEPTPTPTP